MASLRKIIFFIWYNFHKHKLKKTVTEKINGREFLVYPSVFNPKSYFSGKLFAEFVSNLNGLKGKSVLDMGCGSGTVAVFAALNGAEVTAVDINPAAVKCTLENAKRNGVADKIEAYESDLFETPSPSERAGVRFDFIFFNPPYYPKEPQTGFELAFNAGKDYRVIRDFAKQSKPHLKENGAVYMIVSSDIDYNALQDSRFRGNDKEEEGNDRKGGDVGIEVIKNIFNEQGFNFNLVFQKRKLFETFYVIQFTL